MYSGVMMPICGVYSIPPKPPNAAAKAKTNTLNMYGL